MLRWLLVVCAAACACYAAVLAYAEYLFKEDTAASVAAAVRLVPYNAAYVARLASFEPDERIPLLKRAVELNPFDSQSLIQLGLYSELQAKDPVTAERYYRKAAEVNHMFLPKWTLANFYFRQGNATEFFRWANQSLAITPYSPDPIFIEMWAMRPDAARVAAAVPNRPSTLLRYAWFLSNSGRYDAIPPIVQRLVDRVGNSNPRAWGREDLVASIEDHLVAGGHSQDALDIWSTLRKGGWISQNLPSPSHPLTNGDFRTAFYPHGFGWQPVESNGISISHDTEAGSVEIELSGDEAEHAILLKQYLPVTPGRSYRLSWHAVSNDLPMPSGIGWHLRPVVIQRAEDIQSGDLLDNQQLWDLKTPAEAALCLLTLEYTRPFGSVRARGSITVTSVTMTETR